MEMKKLLGVVIITLFALMLFGCGSDSKTSGDTDAAKDGGSETFKVGYMSNFASLNTVVAGIHNEDFKDEGLNVELIEFSDGPTIIAALESGSIDAGYIGPGAHVLPVQGEAKIFAFSHLGNADEVLGNTENGVKSIDDLKGKKIAVASGTSSEMILNLTLKEAGISKDDVKLIDMDASAIVTAMTSGTVDAVAAWSPNTNTIKNELGDKAKMLSNNARYKNEFPSIASWVVSPSYAEENQDTLEKFLSGLYKGMDYRVDHLDEVAKWVAKETAVDEDSVLEQTGDGEWTTSEEMIDMIKDGTLKEYYKKQQENFIEAGQLAEKDEIPVDDYVMFDMMKDAAE